MCHSHCKYVLRIHTCNTHGVGTGKEFLLICGKIPTTFCTRRRDASDVRYVCIHHFAEKTKFSFAKRGINDELKNRIRYIRLEGQASDS